MTVKKSCQTLGNRQKRVVGILSVEGWALCSTSSRKYLILKGCAPLIVLAIRPFYSAVGINIKLHKTYSNANNSCHSNTNGYYLVDTIDFPHVEKMTPTSIFIELPYRHYSVLHLLANLFQHSWLCVYMIAALQILLWTNFNILVVFSFNNS